MTAQPLTLPRDEIAAILPRVIRVDECGATRANPAILIGPPGTGKSSMAIRLAEELGMPWYKFPSHPDALASDLYGSYLPLDGEWTFVPGPMLHAWGHGATGRPGVLILDDIHLAGPGMQAALYTALDAGAGGAYMHPKGHMLQPKAEHVVVCTMNGDIDSLDPAVRDRARVIIPVMEPSTEMLAALRPEIRELCEADSDHNFDPVATYREWRSMSDLWGIVGLERAALMALGTRERAQKMLTAMASIGIGDASEVVVRIARTAPSGVR